MLPPYAVVTAVATFVLLIAGGLVTSTDSGLAVPDWPLSYGMWFPPMVGGIRYEHGHRMVAGAVGLMILGLAVWLARVEPRRWVRRLGVAALAGVVAQALLGGLTVLLLLPPAVSIAHAVLGQTVFVLVVGLAWCTSRSWSDQPPRRDDGRRPSVRALGMATAAVAAGQLLLGAVIRHTGFGMAPHLLGAASLVGLSSVVAARTRARGRQVPSGERSLGVARDRPERAQRVVGRFAWALLGLVVAQSLVGLLVWAHRTSVMLRTTHVAMGALVLAQAVVLAWELAKVPGTFPLRIGRVSAAAADYLELTKARLTLLVVLTAAVGFWLGLRDPARLAVLWPLCLGTALVVGGANALNQWMEREADARMRRTCHRPLPSGRMRPATACRFGLGMSLAGLGILIVFVNLASALFAAAGWASYLLIYTPLKRRTPLCTLVGAVPGALPTLIGWAGARGALTVEAWALFFLLFIWQLPHFLSLAVLYRDDYIRAGFPMLPAIEPDGCVTARQMALGGLALVPISLFPASIGLAGGAYFFGAMLLGLGFFALAARAAWSRSRRSAQQLFRASVLYLPVVLALLAWDRRPI